MSTKPHNIFISWSGPRSKHVALALRQWLGDVLQSARPWMSDSDIDKGSRGIEEISKALDTIEVGISCLTFENLTAPWILYEAGAMSKRIGTKSRLCTYLLAGLSQEHVPPPLGMFQHTRSDKEDTRRMLKSINTAICEEPLADSSLDRAFEKYWPDLEQTIRAMPAPDSTVMEKRPVEDMFAEILSHLRESRVPTQSELEDALNPVRQTQYVNPALRSTAIADHQNFDMAKEAFHQGKEVRLRCARCLSLDLVFADLDNSLTCLKCGAVNTVTMKIQ
jgi:ribosomal protein S27E